MEKFAARSKYTPFRHRTCLVLWVARRGRSFAIVSDEELLKIFAKLNPNVKTVSCWTLSCDVKDVHDLTRDAIIKLLATVVGKVHVMADGWTSPNTISFIGIVIQFVLDGKLHMLTLDFVK